MLGSRQKSSVMFGRRRKVFENSGIMDTKIPRIWLRESWQIYDTTTCWRSVGDKQNLSLFSPTFCQQFANMLLCYSHTPIWVSQHELANISLTYEGRFRLLITEMLRMTNNNERLIFCCKIILTELSWDIHNQKMGASFHQNSHHLQNFHDQTLLTRVPCLSWTPLLPLAGAVPKTWNSR